MPRNYRSYPPPHQPVSKMSTLLDSKVFSACFAPGMPNCAVNMDDSENMARCGRPHHSSSRSVRSKSKDGRRSRGVRGSVYHRKHDTFLAKDDESQQLIAVDVDSSDVSSGTDTNSSDGSTDYSSSYGEDTTRDLNTIGENSTLMAKMRQTLGENKNIINGHLAPPSQKRGVVPRPVSPSSISQNKYDKSIRKKFNYMRLQHQFSTQSGQDPPCDKSLDSSRSTKADSVLGKYGSNNRRNELAKQILRRRKDVVVESRTGTDPPLTKLAKHRGGMYYSG